MPEYKSTFPVFSDQVVIFQDCYGVDGVALTNKFDSKIVDDKSEDDRAPLMAPEARSGGTLLISMLLEALFEEDVG